MRIARDRFTISFTAGEALADGDVVFVSGIGTVSRAAAANAALVVGVADMAAVAGASVEVVIYGRKRVVADGPIAVGDRVRAAATAGRIVAENTTPSAGHSHTENLAAAYTQNATTASATDTIAQGRILGKALGPAVAGGSVEILVCLS